MQMLNTIQDFPGGMNGKEPACQCRRHKRCQFDPWVRKIPWGRKWQPTPVFLPGESHGQRSLVGYSPWRPKESDTTKLLSMHKHDPATVLAKGNTSNIPWILDDFTTDLTKSEGPPVSWVIHLAEAPNAKFSWALITNRHSQNSPESHSLEGFWHISYISSFVRSVQFGGARRNFSACFPWQEVRGWGSRERGFSLPEQLRPTAQSHSHPSSYV